MGAPDLLFPADMPLDEVPSDLLNVAEQAFRILSWQENLPRDEMPPLWMWPLDWEIENWFKKLDQERDSKYGTSSSVKSEPEDDNVFIDRFKS